MNKYCYRLNESLGYNGFSIFDKYSLVLTVGLLSTSIGVASADITQSLKDSSIVNMTQGVTVNRTDIVHGLSQKIEINQTTRNAVINWNTLGVGVADELVFKMPGQYSAVLNRIVGKDQTQIHALGSIKSPNGGKIFISNANGIIMKGVMTALDTGAVIMTQLDVDPSKFINAQVLSFNQGDKLLSTRLPYDLEKGVYVLNVSSTKDGLQLSKTITVNPHTKSYENVPDNLKNANDLAAVVVNGYTVVQPAEKLPTRSSTLPEITVDDTYTDKVPEAPISLKPKETNPKPPVVNESLNTATSQGSKTPDPNTANQTTSGSGSTNQTSTGVSNQSQPTGSNNISSIHTTPDKETLGKPTTSTPVTDKPTTTVKPNKPPITSSDNGNKKPNNGINNGNHNGTTIVIETPKPIKPQESDKVVVVRGGVAYLQSRQTIIIADDSNELIRTTVTAGNKAVAIASTDEISNSNPSFSSIVNDVYSSSADNVQVAQDGSIFLGMKNADNIHDNILDNLQIAQQLNSTSVAFAGLDQSKVNATAESSSSEQSANQTTSSEEAAKAKAQAQAKAQQAAALKAKLKKAKELAKAEQTATTSISNSITGYTSGQTVVRQQLTTELAPASISDLRKAIRAKRQAEENEKSTTNKD